jgi:hypothetical protein
VDVVSKTEVSFVGLTLSAIMDRLGYGDEKFIDRKQMKRLLDLATDPSVRGLKARAARYSIEQIAGALSAVDLLRAQRKYSSGKLDVRLIQIKRASDRLWALGVTYPLTKDVLAWDSESSQYVFTFSGFVVDASDGQTRIRSSLTSLNLDVRDVQEVLDLAQLSLQRRAPAPSMLFRAVAERAEFSKLALLLD